MPSNNRIYYAIEAIGFSKLGQNNYTESHGVQSLGINTRFNLEQVFELGQISLYENIENIPDIEVTVEKVLDGYPPLYCQATNGATAATLTGRSNVRTTMAMNIYGDTQDSASGTPITQCTMSGLYVSQIGWNFVVDGNFTESLTLVGNNKVWQSSAYTFLPAFLNTDQPFSIAGSGGVNRREDFIYYPLVAGGSYSKIPQDVPGISASGTNDQTAGVYSAHLQSVRVSSNLGREPLYELGQRGPYFRYVSFPVEVRTDIECYALNGDQVTALENATSNVTDRTIQFYCREGTLLNLGTKNKLQSVTYGGANAGRQGGNATNQFSYLNFNDCTVTHPKDPSGL